MPGSGVPGAEEAPERGSGGEPALVPRPEPDAPPGGEVMFRRLLEKLPAGAYTCDRAGLITYYNRRAVELWGRAPRLNDPADRYCGSFRLFTTEGLPIRHEECWMARALIAQSEFNGREIVIERPCGDRVTALAHANPIRDDTGEVIGAVNVLVDISDLKRAERALLEADRQKDEFLALLAHELRNPLAPILNAAQLLRSRAEDPVVERCQAVIDRQARQMSRLLDDLLDVARITRGQIRIRRQVVAARTIVDQAVESCRPAIEQRGQSLCVRVDPDSLHLEVDATRLQQVIGNLLSNAAKYTPLGGSISLSLHADGTDAVLRVADTGVGIAAEFLPRIFDLFSQADASLSRADAGLGIGLTLVRRLTELHGGSVSARSDGVGKGSEFQVWLPQACVPSPPFPPDLADRSPEPRATARRVLVVDDNRDAAETLAELVTLWGHRVETAPDGPTALARVRTFEPQVVLLDISMPGMDGYQVVRELRRLPDAGTPYVVALTGYGQEQDLYRALEAGFDRHLTKPVSPDCLRELLAGSLTPGGDPPRTPRTR